MRQMRYGVLVSALLVVVSAGAATKHYSFRNGLPATTVRTVGTESELSAASVSQTKTTASKDEKSLTGVVTKVSDGDTIWVKTSTGREKVRLDRIDAPESDQAYGKDAANFLSDLVLNQTVVVRYTRRDQYNRILGVVYQQRDKGLTDINLTMVVNGAAWHYSYFDKTPAYADAEKSAREAKRGLWAAPNPVNPHDWRKNKRKK